MKRIAFAWHASAWSNAEARWTVEQLAPLLDAPWRHVPPGAASDAGEAVVFVGPVGSAPADAAAAFAVERWSAWDPSTLALATVQGVALPCPHADYPADPVAGRRSEPWLRGLAFLLSREEELRDPRRDQWQCYSGFFTRLHDLGVLGRALVNHHAAALRHDLDAWCESRHSPLPREPRWPGGARFAAALSHDVDDVSLHALPQALRLLAQARAPGSYAVRGGLAAVARALLAIGREDPYWNFERWVGAESRAGFHSTWYFCPPSPSRRHEYDALYGLGDRIRYEGRRVTVRELMRALAERGDEVGLHGSYQSYRDPLELVAQKRQIEAGLGAPVTGTRQHFLRFERGTTWRAQEQAGLTCDSTLGYNEQPGFRAGIAAPFHPWDADGKHPHALLEVPLTLMDGSLFRSLALSPETAITATRAHLSEVESAGGLAGLLWHPNAAAERLFPGWWPCYEAALAQLTERGAWATSAREVERWWRERSARLAG